MSAISVLPIRLFCDLAARNQGLTDLNTSAPPQFYRGDDVEIDIGIGQAGVLLTPNLSNITSVTCQLFASENDTNPPMLSATVLAAAMNLTLTALQWTGNTTPFYHAAFIFAGASTGISLSGMASAPYWLRIFLTTADATPKQITLAEGPITILDGPISVAVLAPTTTGNVRLSTVGGNQVLQIRNDTDGHFYTIGCVMAEGVPTLYVDTTPY
jgi:hypothetical protein